MNNGNPSISTIPLSQSLETGIRIRILKSLLPAHTIKWLFGIYGFLFLTIPGLGFVYSSYSWMDTELFLIALFTITFAGCMYTILGGIYLFAHKNPYLNEWKEKLGYHEK